MKLLNLNNRIPDFSVNVYKLDKTVDKEVKLITLYATPERNRKYHAQSASDWNQPETALCRHQQHESSPIQTNGCSE